MKSIRIHKHGGPEVLRVDTIPKPEICDKDQVIVQMKAWGLNHLDIWVRKGFSNKVLPLPMTLGSDGSGKVVFAGSNLSSSMIGNDVLIQPGIIDDVNKCHSGNEHYSRKYGILGETENGVQSEYIVVSKNNVYNKPKHLTYQEAAAMPLVFMTAYEMLVKKANLKANDRVLIYGGCSGVGSAALQIAKDIGSNIVTTAGNEEKIDFLEKMQFGSVVNHSKSSMFKTLKDLTDGNGFDVIFEHIGNKTWDKSIRLLNKGGRIVTCGATTGFNVQINLAHLFIKQQSILGSTMAGTDSFFEVMSKIKQKKYYPVISKTFNFKDIFSAHQYIENRHNFGKVVLDNE